MLRNYFAIAIRSLLANRLHSLINIGGLAVGLAACLLILLFVRDELSYDRWLPNADRIVNVEMRVKVPGRETMEFVKTPGPYKAALEKDFGSDIERVVRLFDTASAMRAGDRKLVGDLTFVDPGFFQVFDLPMVTGDREAAIANNASIIVSQSMARKLVGDAPAVGTTITANSIGEDRVFTIVGVFADIPANSHLKLESIALFDTERYKDGPPYAACWACPNFRTYVLLRSPDARTRIAADLPAFLARNDRTDLPGPRAQLELELRPVLDIHLHADKPGYDNPGSFALVVAFAGIALLVLVIACINFVNLATARAMTRAREVALRKTVGATRGQLVIQHLGEAVLVALVALIFAVAIVELALGPFNSFLHKQLQLDLIGDPGLLLAMLGLVAVVGLVAGLYPALYLSRFRPATVLKANQSSASGSSRLRAALVVFQFAISIGLIVCTAVIYLQTVYARTFDLGFAKEDRLVLWGASELPTTEARATLSREIAALPGVRGVAMSSDTPPRLGRSDNVSLSPTRTRGDTAYMVEHLEVDPDFFSVYAIAPLAGRLFSHDRRTDFAPTDEDRAKGETHCALVVNRAFALQLGAVDPAEVIGRVLYMLGSEPGEPMVTTTIVGVVPDLHLRSARHVVTPMVYYANPPERLDQLTVHFDRSRQQEVIAGVEAVWNRLGPSVPIRTGFVDEGLAEQYDADVQRGQVFGGFAMFAILIACLGLFGLASFSAQRRTKEIGMRKVLGASVLDIVRLLVWQFSRPVLIASLIAWPLSFYVMGRWLSGFEYAISMTDPPVLASFVGATLLAVAIAWLTTAGHAFHVARANPARSLRTE